MSRSLVLCVALTACSAAEDGEVAAPRTAAGIAAAAPAAPAASAGEGACASADLDQLVTHLRGASGEVRLGLLVAGVKQACPTIEPGMLAWLAALDDAGSPPEAAALRSTLCPGGEDLWAAPAADWAAWSSAVWQRCGLNSQSLLTRAELAGGAGPEAALLGIALHNHLLSTHAGHARTLGRWVAGHPPDPSAHLPRRRYGAFGQAAPVALLGSAASRPPGTRCMPVLSLTPESLTVDQAPHSLTTLATALAPCQSQADFRGVLLVAVQPDTAAARLVATLQAAGTAQYSAAELLVRMGDPGTDAVVPAHDALVAVRQVTWVPAPTSVSSSSASAPEAAAASARSPAPSTAGAKGKSGGKSSASGASSAGSGGLIGGLVGGGGGRDVPAPRIHLTRNGFTVAEGAAPGLAASGRLAELPAVLQGLDNAGDVLEVRVSEEVPFSALMAVLEAAQGADSAAGRSLGPFPFVKVGLAPP